MIFCVSHRIIDHAEFPYVRSVNGLLVYSSTPLEDCNFFGYRLSSFYSGNWWTIEFSGDQVRFARSVLADYRWGSDVNNGVLLTNHPNFLKIYLSSLAVSASVCCKNSKITLEKYRFNSKRDTKDLVSVTDEVQQRLLQNFDILLSQYNCQHVSYSLGMDSSVNVLNSLSKPVTILITDRTQKELLSHNVSFIDNQIMSPEIRSRRPEFGTADRQVDQHFYDVQRVIDGSYGDLTLGHTGFFSRLPPEERLKFSTDQIYDSRPSNLPPLATRNQILYELVNTAVHEARRGIFSDHCVYDTYRDIDLLEMLMQLSTDELIRQLITGHIQKCILAGSGLLVTQHKGQTSSVCIA